ncbi:hypothetical protein THAOC_26431 [Thalassiosira oceanica]|uniref:Sulfotransferase domain-containing protein n=1 Tax=Thalassiosira oceanica TaxID=159749 RepID=K0S545_THAOC|nr:hypothetical protein THAOC_26431 [Thalassiosira oceanica]|eukprot:EJK54022.1 hypothetical protein THAOC_26431 [Thalassiosira oceanica]
MSSHGRPNQIDWPDMGTLAGLPRQPLSLILSYLQQPLDECHKRRPHNCDGIALLLTSRRFAYAILPMFRVPKHVCRSINQFDQDSGGWKCIVERLRFVPLPIIDPRTLLDRLNTRRIRRRIKWVHERQNCSTDDEFVDAICFQRGRTVEELAYEEWAVSRLTYDDESENDNDHNGSAQWRIWPAHLELLRFSLSEGVESNPEVQSQQTGKLPQAVSRFSASLKLKLKSNLVTDAAPHGARKGITLLASYPRSGNTLLRTLLEKVLSQVTGSDTRPDRTLSKSLALDHDLVGEGLIGLPDNAVGIKPKRTSIRSTYQCAYEPGVDVVKTHFPERKGWKQLCGRKVLLLVRNPYDAIDSYWNLCCTNTHTRTLEESVYEQYATKFDRLARHEIKIWCDFHFYWTDLCEREGVPLLIVRYEDLVLDTEGELSRIMRFLHDKDALDPFWSWRVRHAVGKSHAIGKNEQSGVSNTSSLGSYKPRSSGGGLKSIGKSIRRGRYSSSTLRHMHEVASALRTERREKETCLRQFGYDIEEQSFPLNFAKPPPLPVFHTRRRGNGSVTINKTLEIRRDDDEFGRKMTFWRRGETENDTKPFPTVPR